MSKSQEKMDEQLVDSFRGKPVTLAMYRAAFNGVCEANWKMPIDKHVDLPDEMSRYVLSQAVIFFTGSVPEIFPVPDGKLRSDGVHLTALN